MERGTMAWGGNSRRGICVAPDRLPFTRGNGADYVQRFEAQQ